MEGCYRFAHPWHKHCYSSDLWLIITAGCRGQGQISTSAVGKKLHVCSFHFHNTEILAGGFRMTPNHVVKLHTDINIYSLISFSFIYSSPSSLLFFASLQLNWRFEFNFFAWWNIMRLFLGSLYLMCAYFPGISYIISTLKIPLLVWLNVSLPTHYSTLLLQGEPPTASPFFNNSLSAYCVPINRNMTRNSALNT